MFDWILMNFEKGRGILSFIVCAAVSLALVSLSSEGKTVFHEVAIMTILAPVEQIVSVKKGYFNVVEKNKVLKSQNISLKVENDLLKQYRRQNVRLRRMLVFKEGSDYNLIPGEIVARDPGRYEMTWIVNLGRSDSVNVNMPVLTSRGVVGKVSKVFGNYSVVQLVQDPNCKLSVLNSRSRVIGILESYKVGKLIARFPAHSDIIAGDTVVTSGMGGVFPKGLSVGVVMDEDLESNDIIKGAEVSLFQDVSLVEEVFVFRKQAHWTVGRLE